MSEQPRADTITLSNEIEIAKDVKISPLAKIMILLDDPRSSRATLLSAQEGRVTTRANRLPPMSADDTFAAGRALKFVRCIALTQGIHLNVDTYTELKTRDVVAERLAAFQNQLEPLLDALSVQLEAASQQAEEIKESTARLTIENRKLESDISSLRLQREILLVVARLAVSTYISLF